MPTVASTDDRAPGDGFLVLWVGGMEIVERDTQVELRRAGVRVEAADADDLPARANDRAPDLVVLGGEHGEAPDALVDALRRSSLGAALPVVAFVPHRAADPRPRSRYGLVAQLDRDLDAPALAAQLATLLRRFSAHAPVWRMTARSTDLGSVAARLAASRRCGLLTAEAGAIAVDADGIVAPRALPVREDEPVVFHERPAGRVRVCRTSATASASRSRPLDGVRVAVIDDDVGRREVIVRRLEGTGAQVRATGLVAQAVHATRALDPAVIVVAAPALRSSAVAPLWSEPRLAAAAVLAVDEAALTSHDALVPQVCELAEPELTIAERLRAQGALAERLESLGATRWLKLLGRCAHEVTLRVFGAAGRVRVDLAGGRIRGASFHPAGTQADVVQGRAAVDALLAMPFGRVLAGPPDAVAALEGVSALRKASVVGRIEPTPSAGLPRNRGLVAKEIVVRRTEASPPSKTSPTNAQPAPAVPKPIPAPRPPKPALGVAKAGAAATPLRALKPEALARALPRSEKVPEPARREASSSKGAPTAPKTARASAQSGASIEHLAGVPPAARARSASAPVETPPDEERAPSAATSRRDLSTPAGGEECAAPPSSNVVDVTGLADGTDIATPMHPKGAAEPLRAPGAARETQLASSSSLDRSSDSRDLSTSSAELAPVATGREATASRAASSSLAPLPDAPSVSARDEAPRPEASTAPSLHRPEPAPDVEAPPPAPRSKARGALWFLAGALVALGAGAWAAWRLHDHAPAAFERASASTDAPAERSVAPETAAHADGAAAPISSIHGSVRQHDAPAHRAAAGPSALGDGDAPPAPAPEVPNDAPANVRGEPAEERLGAAALVAQAQAAARAGDYARSEVLSRRALELDPHHAKAAYRLAVALFRQRRYGEAMPHAEAASRLDDDDPLPLMLIGDIEARQGRFVHAARAYRRALEVSPNFDPAERALERLRARGIR